MNIHFVATGAGILSLRKFSQQFPHAVQGGVRRAEKEVSGVIRRHIHKQFQSGGIPRWAPRTRSYRWKPLLKTGRMRAAAIRATRGRIVTITRRRIIIQYRGFWMATKYSRFHLSGTRRMPARPFAPPFSRLSRAETNEIGQSVRKNLQHSIRGLKGL